MCKLVVGINQKPNNKEFEKYIEAQQTELLTEDDGCSALIITNDNKTHVFRSLKDYNWVFRSVYELLPQAKLVSIHTRTGTSGQKTLQNVHFFEDDNHYLAHNGFVMKYHRGYLYDSRLGFKNESTFYQTKINHGESDTAFVELGTETKDPTCEGCYESKKGICRKHRRQPSLMLPTNTNEICDTFQFLKKMTKPVTLSSLEKDIKESDFSGVGIVVNKKIPEAYLIVEKDVKLQTDKETFGIFYSYMPDKESKMPTPENIFGVDIVKTNIVKTDLPIRTAFQGVYKLQI